MLKSFAVFLLLLTSPCSSFSLKAAPWKIYPHRTRLSGWRIPFMEPKERSRKQLSEGIAQFYDKSSALWERVWGEHMHHGYYPVGSSPKTIEDHRAAQVDMVDKILDWAGAEGSFWDGSTSPAAWKPSSVVDVGCGIGGSTRHIAKRFNVRKGVGITLSPYQRGRASELSTEAGLDQLEFKVHDVFQ